MGPRFNDPLYFQSDGALEVCGPADFGPNDISLELLKVTVVDKNGVERHTPDLSILVAAGEMWETDIDNVQGVLAPGHRQGSRSRARDEAERRHEGHRMGRPLRLDRSGTFLDASEGD